MPTVLVIDISASVRETLRIVLGHEHEVTAIAGVAALPSALAPDVVVLGLPSPPRDDTAIGSALAGSLSGIPVLLLHAPRETDVRRLVPPRVAVDFLPKPFDAYAVRARVRSLVAARAAAVREAERRREEPRHLEAPFLAPAGAAVVRRILAGGVDVVLVQGERGTGVAAVARALHVAGRWPGTFVALDAARLARGELAAALSDERAESATVYLANLDRATLDVQGDVAQLVDDVRRGARKLHVIAGATRDLCELAASGEVLAELAYAVSAVPVILAPLRERIDDIPALVDSLTHELAPRLGLAAVDYRPATLDRLRQYMWFGNVAELEAVVTRTLVLHRPSVVEPEHLVFFPEEAAHAVAPGPAISSTRPTVAAVGTGEALARLDLEVVLGELAHELRNPMVTIKTVAQHLDSILADPEARQRFSELMAEAVGRMDGLLENLLDFSRFRAPVRRSVDIGSLLDRMLAEQREDLDRRHVRVERNGGRPQPAEVDEAQVLFALRSLCRGLVPNLVPNSALAIRAVEDGGFEMRMRAEPSVASRLSAWVEPPSAGAAETPPLAWALAAALLERNGGALSVRTGDDQTTVLRVDWTRRTGHGNAIGTERMEG